MTGVVRDAMLLVMLATVVFASAGLLAWTVVA
jgi:hypothetical protein